MSDNKVEYRRLGSSGLRVSVPILGTMGYGSTKWLPWARGEKEALPLLKAAWDGGINTFDTANNYSNGLSEVIIGKFIATYKIPRDKLVIMTKCCGFVADDISQHPFLTPGYGDQRDTVNQGGLSRKAIFASVEASLERLGTTYIDVLQLHRYDPDTPIEETLRALHDLVVMGKVRYIGACTMLTWQFVQLNCAAELNGWTKFISMQSEYSLLYREEEREMFSYCKANGIGIIPYWSLASGDLARPLGSKTARSEWINMTPFAPKYSEADKQIIQRVGEIAKRHGWPMATVALAWIATKVTSPIVGLNSVNKIQESILTGKTLTEEELKYLEEPYEPKKSRV